MDTKKEILGSYVGQGIYGAKARTLFQKTLRREMEIKDQALREQNALVNTNIYAGRDNVDNL